MKLVKYMKKFLSLLLIISVILGVTVGCAKKEEEKKEGNIDYTIQTDAEKFKDEYEALNGTKNSSNQEHRTITIPKENPIVYSTAPDIVKMMDNKETFYVYFGSRYCPWCRSVIEKALEVANENNIDKIYYVDAWSDDHVEALRDTYVLNDKNKPELKSEGGAGYQELLERLDKVLSAYTLTTSKGKKVKVGEKRIFLPNFVYVEDGKAIELVEGQSDKQEGSSDQLTDEILADEEKTFEKFFNRQ